VFGKTSPDAAAQQVAEAVTARDADAYESALQGLVKALQKAKPADIRPALLTLAPVLAEAPLGPTADLARIAGAMADMADDPSPVLGVLVKRACEAMEGAAAFRVLHSELVGTPPRHPSKIPETLEQFSPAAEGRVERPQALVEAWFAGNDWVQPVLFLSQRADVRAALPQRERLSAAVDAVREDFDCAGWLYGLLRVLDDEHLVVLHRETGRGFRVTIGGIGDNFQLHTLLADRLIGKGALPGTAPTPAMVAAADGSGDPQPPGGVAGQFNLVDAYGAWIWNEGRPSEIPLFEGERVVVLDPQPYPRSWNAGRVYPLMRPTARVDGPLPAGEASALLSKVAPATTNPTNPPGTVVTDDLSIGLPAGRTVAEVVDFVLEAMLRGVPADELEASLMAEFALSEDHAFLARDRTCGGLVRASTRNEANRPAADKDPVAWESYRRGVADPSLLTRIDPDA
jgi:hypothetical protein